MTRATTTRGRRRTGQLVEQTQQGVSVLGQEQPQQLPAEPEQPQQVTLTAASGTCVTVPEHLAGALRRQGWR